MDVGEVDASVRRGRIVGGGTVLYRMRNQTAKDSLCLCALLSCEVNVRKCDEKT